MRTTTFLIALAATLLLAFAAGTATALRSFSVSETSTSVKIPNLIVSEEGGTTLTAEVTLNKTMSRAFPKREGVLTGGITGVRIENCRAPLGAACSPRVLLERNNSTACGASARLCPVNHRTFNTAFIGTLPNPRQLEGTNETFVLIEVPLLGKSCLYSGEAGLVYNLEARGGVLNGEATTRAIPLTTRLSGTCGATLRYRGTSNAPSPAVTVILI